MLLHMLYLLIDESEFVCPITLQLFLCPVVASDKNVYEKKAIKKCKRSPLTRKKIKGYYRCLKIKTIIDKWTEKNPDMWLERFSVKFCYDKYVRIQEKYGNERSLYYLLSSHDIDTRVIRQHIPEKYVFVIFKKCTQDGESSQYLSHFFIGYGLSVLKKFDQLVDISQKHYNSTTLIHDLCGYIIESELTDTDRYEMLEYLLKTKKFNINDDGGFIFKTPLEIACRHNIVCVKMLVDHGACYNYDFPILHQIIRFCCSAIKLEMLEYFIKEKNVDINIKWKYKGVDISPLFLACLVNNKNAINYLIDNGADQNIFDLYYAGLKDNLFDNMPYLSFRKGAFDDDVFLTLAENDKFNEPII